MLDGRFWVRTMFTGEKQRVGTGGKGSGSLPTPSQRDWKGGSGTVKFDENGKACRVSDTTGTKYGVRLDALVDACEERGYWPTPNTLEGAKPKPLENIIRHNKKGRPGRSYLAMNLRELVHYGVIPHPDKVYLTPSSILIEGGDDRIEKRTEYRKSIGRQYVPGCLAEQIKWATPSGMDVRTDVRKPEDRSDEANKGGCANLREQVQWPTPRISGQEGYKTRSKRKGHDVAMSYLESNVEYVEEQNWPTPIEGDAHLSSNPEVAQKRLDEGKITLSRRVQKWPTPRKSEYKDTGPVGSKSHKHMDERDYLCAKTKDPERPKGQLNPNWVEWLMGWPIFWTSLDPLRELIWIDWLIDPADIGYDGNYPTASACQRGPHVGREMDGLSTESLTTGTRFGMTLETFAKHNPGRTWQTYAPGTHARGMYPLTKNVEALVKGEKPSVQVLTVDEVFAEEVKKQLWPSPRAGNPGSRPNKKGGKILAEEAKKEEKNWQTPSVEDAGRQGSSEAWDEYENDGRTTQCRLRNQVQSKVPTPRATDWKDGGWNSKNKDRKEEISCPGYAKTHQGQGIIPRVGVSIPNRVSRLKAIGNGQVPQTTALAFEILTNGLLDMEMQSETTD